MLNKSFQSLHLPKTRTQTFISLLLKKGKDTLQYISSISFLNVDFKTLFKSLAMSLERNLPSLFSLDQTGFIQHRHSSNLQIEFSLEYLLPYSHSTQSEAFSAAREIKA